MGDSSAAKDAREDAAVAPAAAPSPSLAAPAAIPAGSTVAAKAIDPRVLAANQASAAVAANPNLNPIQTKQGSTQFFGVNTEVAKNPYLAGDLGKIAAQQAAVQGQTAAQATTPSQSLVAQSAGAGANAQAQSYAQLQQQAQGGGPAAQAVQMQSQNATNQGINAQMAMAGSMRGGNAGEALRQASVGQANVTGQAANQAAMNTLQSEQQGIAGAANAAQGMAQNDQFNAGATNQANAQTQQLGEQTALANAAGSNQFTQQQNSQIQSLMNSGMSLEQAQQQANISMAEYSAGSAADQYAASQGHAISQQNADTSSASAAISGLSTAANVGTAIGTAASDKRAKKDIKKGDKETSAFLDHLAAKEWNYKYPDKHGHGKHLGVMAQDLEKSKMGRDMVKTGADGVKMVEYGGAKGMAAIVASLAMLNEKIKKMESLKGKR